MSVTESGDVFELGDEHEQVVFANDPATGLQAIIAIHSTALGPALGGTRFYPYASTGGRGRATSSTSRAGCPTRPRSPASTSAAARPSSSATPHTLKSEALLRAYGRLRRSRSTAATTPPATSAPSATDMDDIARECSFVTGRTVAHGGAGDSSVLTAYGVFQGMRAAAEVVWGEPTLAGRTVGVAGVGKVGQHLVRHLVEDGATVVVTDVHAAVARAGPRRAPAGPGRRRRPTRSSPRALDVYAPCALGGALTDEVVEMLSAKIVCGAANNQLAHPGVEKSLEERGILYAPDYCVNSGGLIQVADELEGFSFERAQQRAAGIFDTTRAVFELAPRRQRAAGHRRRPAGRAADARRRPPARHLARRVAALGHRRPSTASPDETGGAGSERADARSVAARGSMYVRPLLETSGIDLLGVSWPASPCSSLASAPKSVS